MADSISLKKQSAFTLIELLVVISIIALLIAILLPVLSSARRASSLVRELSNMRQVGIAIHAYGADNNDRLPGGTGVFPRPWDHDFVRGRLYDGYLAGGENAGPQSGNRDDITSDLWGCPLSADMGLSVSRQRTNSWFWNIGPHGSVADINGQHIIVWTKGRSTPWNPDDDEVTLDGRGFYREYRVGKDLMRPSETLIISDAAYLPAQWAGGPAGGSTMHMHSGHNEAPVHKSERRRLEPLDTTWWLLDGHAELRDPFWNWTADNGKGAWY